MEVQNEYAKEIKEYRAREGAGKAHGKVFVKGPKQSIAIASPLSIGIEFPKYLEFNILVFPYPGFQLGSVAR
jgi:hypothetical protein